jgi:hypothetical protein
MVMSQRERKIEREREREREKDYKKLAQTIKQVDKSQDLQLAN